MRFVATAGTLAAIDAGQVIDGVTVVAGNSFLFQPVTAGIAATGATHGIYVAAADGVAPTRRADADTGAEIYHAAVVVQEGTVGAGQQWICVTEPAPAVGTDGITFRLMGTGDGGGGGGGDAADVMLPAAADFATYSDAADLVATAGYNVYSDAGGMMWKRGSTTMPTTLTYFRRQDFGGVWYEAVRNAPSWASRSASSGPAPALMSGRTSTKRLPGSAAREAGGWCCLPASATLISICSATLTGSGSRAQRPASQQAVRVRCCGWLRPGASTWRGGQDGALCFQMFRYEGHAGRIDGHLFFRSHKFRKIRFSDIQVRAVTVSCRRAIRSTVRSSR